MKRSVEEKIMVQAVSSIGFPISEELSKALCEGLKQIRIAKHQENTERKRRYEEQHNGHPCRHHRRKKKPPDSEDNDSIPELP